MRTVASAGKHVLMPSTREALRSPSRFPLPDPNVGDAPALVVADADTVVDGVGPVAIAEGLAVPFVECGAQGEHGEGVAEGDVDGVVDGVGDFESELCGAQGAHGVGE